ncbi:hypothetical protein BUALT_Bualt13G0037500 [Buddleja alternifolia]|uniref:(+)-delta-cadinene synthase n=1 Tax=Buddleja alternifolia TaxID=168488 RepID=A0AAV6WVA8_9LAMI|nr:hypothetical protein BUALT_Bualt13G0037500 [Buddleja alternifolia]
MAAVSIFQGPTLKVYGRRSLCADLHTSFNYCTVFPKSELKHKQCRSRGLPLIKPMASATALDGPEGSTLRPAVKPYRPSLWADMSFSFDKQLHESYAEAIEGLKEEVRSMVMGKDSKPKDKMMLIDTLERLGVAYHFEQEIEDQIQLIFKSHAEDNDDLFTTALYFRLFRQHGYDVPSSVFDKFKDKDNKFNKTLIHDVNGLLSLYEASYLRYHGENILEEAMVFTTYYLNQAKMQVGSYLQEKVTRALEQPIHRGVEKVEARYYISIYEKNESKNELLLTLAKLDFNFLQNLYKKEIADIFKWWKESNFTSKFPYMRERVMESYFWMVGIHFKPEYSFSRSAATKALVLATVLNDTYGNYATLEELDIFTDILQRQFTQLSTYESTHTKCFGLLEHKQTANAYYKKAKWYKGGEMPTFEDHISNGYHASAAAVILTAIFLGMESASKEAFDWLMSEPQIVVAGGFITRHMNDIGSYEREHEEGVFPTPVDCYMIENGVSKQEALDKIHEFVEDQWKTINKEWVVSCVPRHWMKPALNYARVQDASYKGGKDMFTSPEEGLGQDIFALFVNPIVI